MLQITSSIIVLARSGDSLTFFFLASLAESLPFWASLLGEGRASWFSLLSCLESDWRLSVEAVPISDFMVLRF